MKLSIDQSIESSMMKYFESFIEEDFDGIVYKTLPTKDKIPIIKQFGYDKERDMFELVFKYDESNNIILKRDGFIVFLENNNGELLAIQILGYKKRKVEKLKVKIQTTIEHEIKDVEMEITQKKMKVPNGIIEKRKLRMLNEMLSNNIKDMSKREITATDENLTIAST